ncbi:MAG TPA: BatD family protein [Parasegetibacter sp.]|jgi:hypothetical protein
MKDFIRQIKKGRLFAVLLLFTSNSIFAQVEVHSSVDRNKILIGEPIKLRIETRIPENLPIIFPSLDSLPHFEIIDQSEIDTSTSGALTVMLKEMNITSFDSGSWYIPAMQIELNEKIYRSDSIRIEVSYLPIDESTDYQDIVDVKSVKDPWRYLKYVFALLLLLFAAWAIWYVIKNRNKQRSAESFPHLTPFEEAMKLLENLEKDAPSAKEKYTRLVNIFKGFLRRQRKIDAGRKTTEELVLVLNSTGLSREQYTALAQVLRMSDMVKFAKYIPSGEEDRESIETIRKTIQTLNSAN